MQAQKVPPDRMAGREVDSGAQGALDP